MDQVTIYDEKRIREIEDAYLEMKKRGWGFVSNGNGFGDPSASLTGVGPFDGFLVEVLAFDSDPVKAVYEAIKRFDDKKEADHS